MQTSSILVNFFFLHQEVAACLLHLIVPTRDQSEYELQAGGAAGHPEAEAEQRGRGRHHRPRVGMPTFCLLQLH